MISQWNTLASAAKGNAYWCALCAIALFSEAMYLGVFPWPAAIATLICYYHVYRYLGYSGKAKTEEFQGIKSSKVEEPQIVEEGVRGCTCGANGRTD